MGRRLGRSAGFAQGFRDEVEFSTVHRACLMRAVSSCTRLYTDLSSRIRRAIFDVAWMTVVWSRPPNSPDLGQREGRSARVRGTSPGGVDDDCERLSPQSSSIVRPKRSETVSWILDRDLGQLALREDVLQHVLRELDRHRPAGERRERDDAGERALELADVRRDPAGDEGEDLRIVSRISSVFTFLRRIAIRVSRSGGWMSVIRPHSKRERRRSSSVAISRGGRSDEITICAPTRRAS